MFCTKCGSQMPDGSAFCASCGSPLIQPTPTEEPKRDEHNKAAQDIPAFLNPEDSVFDNSAANEATAQQPKPKKKKKTALIVSLCAVALLLILSAAALTVYWMLLRNEQHAEAIWAYVDKDGTAYLCYGDGEKLSINGVEDAFMTPDQKKVVVLEKGGDLYWTDVKFSEKHVIINSSKDTEIELDNYWLYNDSFFYIVECPYLKDGTEVMDEILYRYSFEDESNIKAFVESEGDVDDLVITQGYSYAKSASVAIARDGWIEVLNADSNEFKKLTKYDKERDIELMAIAPDGNTLIWAIETDDADYTIYYSYNDTVTKLKSSVEDLVDAAISADNRLAFVSFDQDLIYIRGEEYESIHFSDEINYYCTEDGRNIFDDADTYKDQGCFVEIEGAESNTLYYVDFEDATKYKLLNAETIFIASSDKIIYKTDGGRYMYAEFDPKEPSLGNEYTITSADSVRFFNLTECSDYVVFCVYDEDYDQSMADLYYYDVGENQSRKITSEVLSYIKISTDGTKLFYFDDVNKEEATGTLMMYDIKKEESKQISTDVLVHTVTSYFFNGTIDPDSFFYGTRESDDESDVHYYNGKKSSITVSGFEY